MEHTATPWEQRPGADHDNAPILIGPRGRYVCAISGTARAILQAESNAAFIVRACNNFEELLEALKAVMELFDPYAIPGYPIPEQVHARALEAIRKAEEE